MGDALNCPPMALERPAHVLGQHGKAISARSIVEAHSAIERVKMTSLETMAHSGVLTGTLVRSKSNGGVYWSNTYWHSPADALEFQPHKWTYVCSDGWYSDGNNKTVALALRTLAGDNWPQMPGEYATFHGGV